MNQSTVGAKRILTRSASARWGSWNRRRNGSQAAVQTRPARYEFKLTFFDRRDLCSGGAALDTLSALGLAGWHIVYVRENGDPHNALAVFLERECR
jgi:hypothetical protein